MQTLFQALLILLNNNVLLLVTVEHAITMKAVFSHVLAGCFLLILNARPALWQLNRQAIQS
ncbi:hypothetical protein OAE97_03165 [Verrucomicrobia bacterium]|nr:hypothetical protein [Verrucomicrobiota bacterium]MDB4665325.1 hypothetical protein [Verrucomicrobiota bacterium]MDG1892196.1 hypothetical protein [Verrucomicrobiota bacterium]